MTERIKLENPGEELTLTVASISAEEVGGYDYWKVSDGKQEFLVPQKSIAAQLDRVGVEAAPQMVGKTVRFSRSEKVNKFNKPYWNLDLATGNGKPPVAKAPPAKPPSFANKPDSELPPLLRNAEQEDNAELAAKIGFNVSTIQKELALYQALVEFVVRDVAPIYEKGKVGMSPESAAASVQTLFINLSGK